MCFKALSESFLPLEMFNCSYLLLQQKKKMVLVSSRLSLSDIPAVLAIYSAWKCGPFLISTRILVYITHTHKMWLVLEFLCIWILTEHVSGLGRESVCSTIVPFIWQAPSIYVECCSFLI